MRGAIIRGGIIGAFLGAFLGIAGAAFTGENIIIGVILIDVTIGGTICGTIGGIFAAKVLYPPPEGEITTSPDTLAMDWYLNEEKGCWELRATGRSGHPGFIGGGIFGGFFGGIVGGFYGGILGAGLGAESIAIDVAIGVAIYTVAAAAFIKRPGLRCKVGWHHGNWVYVSGDQGVGFDPSGEICAQVYTCPQCGKQRSRIWHDVQGWTSDGFFKSTESGGCVRCKKQQKLRKPQVKSYP